MIINRCTVAQIADVARNMVLAQCTHTHTKNTQAHTLRYEEDTR